MLWGAVVYSLQKSRHRPALEATFLLCELPNRYLHQGENEELTLILALTAKISECIWSQARLTFFPSSQHLTLHCPPCCIYKLCWPRAAKELAWVPATWCERPQKLCPSSLVSGHQCTWGRTKCDIGHMDGGLSGEGEHRWQDVTQMLEDDLTEMLIVWREQQRRTSFFWLLI